MQNKMRAAEKLQPTIKKLQDIAGKKEFRVKSAYQLFVEDKMKVMKATKATKQLGSMMKEIAALWKDVPAKEKEKYEKMQQREKAKQTDVNKEWDKAFDASWGDIEQYLDAEEANQEELKQIKKDSRKADKEKAKKKKVELKAARVAKKHATRVKRSTRTVRAKHLKTKRPAPTKKVSNASSESNIAKMQSMMVGLPKHWNVRESTSRPGFFYYVNEITNQSTSQRPVAAGAAPLLKRGR